MSDDEIKEVQKGLEGKRDSLQAILQDARKVRVSLQLSNIDKYRDFLQRLGELSFAFGAAILPLVLVTHKDGDIPYLGYVIVGVCIYLINGLLSLWRSKDILERNGDDTPYIGLDEEIRTYPVIHAHNKLLFDLENEKYQKEYKSASLAYLKWAPEAATTKILKPSLWLDVLLIAFVVASFLIVRVLWPYDDRLYWISFAVLLIIMAILTKVSYGRSSKSQLELNNKRKKLARIKKKYQDWHNKNVFKEEPEE